MSKFIDKLNQISRAVPQPVGFRTTRSVSVKPRMLLVAGLAQANVENLADCVAGADAGLLPVSGSRSRAKTLQKISQAVPDIPWGGWLRGGGQEGIKQMAKVGCDFVIFPAANTSLAVFQGDEPGRILEVESSLSDGLVRAINELPVDAVLIASQRQEGYWLTWHHLMLFQRFADLLTKPLLVSIPSGVMTGELQALWQAGVNGVVVEVGGGRAVGRVKELRQLIDKLVPPSPRRQGKAKALLPFVGQEPSAPTEEEEEEEE